jgi:hypothetical protein
MSDSMHRIAPAELRLCSAPRIALREHAALFAALKRAIYGQVTVIFHSLKRADLQSYLLGVFLWLFIIYDSFLHFYLLLFVI